MRCFIAVDLPKEIKDKLYDLQKSFGNIIKVSWVYKKNLHCTLKFLGEVSEKDLTIIKETLSKIKFKKFKMNFDKFGVFPGESYIKVIWVGLKPAGKIIELQQKIDSELLEAGFNKDERFSAHLTLGRVKFVKDKNALKDKLKELNLDGSFEVSEFFLIKSTLTKEGPVYEIIEKFQFS